MKQIVLFVGLLFLFCAGCASESTDPMNSHVLKSFAVYVEDTKYTGIIDEDSREVRIGGIRYPASISKVKWELQEGATMDEPTPSSFIGDSWKKEMNFSVSLSSGEKVVYKLILSDYQDISQLDYKSIGYLISTHYPWHRQEVRWDLLTHIIVNCVKVRADASLVEESFEYENSARQAVEDAHLHNRQVLMSVCSDAEGGFYMAIKDEALRSRLVQNLLECANRYGFDGIDIDYELSKENDKEYLDLFAKELCAQKGDLLLTAAVYPDEWRYTQKFHEYFDWINIMAYDHGGWDGDQKLPGQAASYEDAVNDIEIWIAKYQTPADKLVLGLPFFGFSWDDNVKTEHESGYGGGGYASYANIVEAYPDAIDLDNVNQTWYNGRVTIRRKCQLAKSRGLLGVMIWHIFYDTTDDETSLMVVVGEEMNQSDKKSIGD